MKGNGLKTLGMALMGGLALLFAGCQQQAAPPPQGPTTVAVEGLYSYDTQTPVDLNDVSGLVIVRAKVALGSVVPDKVQFLLDNNVEYEVSFGAATQGLRPQQATYTFEWNLNTRALNNLVPKYPNGPRAVKVQLVKGTQVVAASQATNVVFNNGDFAVFKFSGNALNKGGKRYYGGGDVTIEVVPVLYSGKTLASVRLSLSAVDLDPNTPGVQSTKTLTAAPYVFTIPYAPNKNQSVLDGSIALASSPYTIFTLTYSDTTTLSPFGYAVLDGSQVLADTTGLFSNNPPFVFVNFRIDFDGPSGSGAIACQGTTLLGSGGFANNSNLRAGLSSFSLDAGVGGDKLVADVKTTTNQTVLSDVEVPLSGGGCAGAGPLSGLSEGGFFQVVAKALKDDLGNVRTISPASASSAFAIDETKPTIALKTRRDNRIYFNSPSLSTGSLAGADLADNAIGADITTLADVDDPSSGTPPVASGVASYRWTVNGQVVVVSAGNPYTGSNIPGLDHIQTTLNQAAPTQGYYTLTVQAKDGAGNLSDPLTLNVLYDNTDPNVVFTAPANPTLTGGATFAATASATDNVDLLQGRIYWSYGSANIRFEAYSSPVKAFGAPGVTSQNYTATLTALKPTSGNFDLFAQVRDQARNAPATATLSLSVTPANTNAAGSVSSVSETPDITQASGGSTTLTIQHLPAPTNPATLKAVHVYLWNETDGTFDYYNFVGDAQPIGGGQYAVVVTVPANLGTPQFLIVLEYDNGRAVGHTYNYHTNALPLPVF